MSLRIVVDMNLSVEWVPLLEQAGWHAVHWSGIGDPRPDDATIMAWALEHEHSVFTHDLDSGTPAELSAGALVVVEQAESRVRIVPL